MGAALRFPILALWAALALSVAGCGATYPADWRGASCTVGNSPWGTGRTVTVGFGKDAAPDASVSVTPDCALTVRAVGKGPASPASAASSAQ